MVYTARDVVNQDGLGMDTARDVANQDGFNQGCQTRVDQRWIQLGTWQTEVDTTRDMSEQDG